MVNLAEVFSKSKTQDLPPHHPWDWAKDVLPHAVSIQYLPLIHKKLSNVLEVPIWATDLSIHFSSCMIFFLCGEIGWQPETL